MVLVHPLQLQLEVLVWRKKENLKKNPPDAEKRTNKKLNPHTIPLSVSANQTGRDTLVKSEPVLSALNQNQIKANQRHL